MNLSTMIIMSFIVLSMINKAEMRTVVKLDEKSVQDPLAVPDNRCKGNDQICGSDSECCSGYCQDSHTHGYYCEEFGYNLV